MKVSAIVDILAILAICEGEFTKHRRTFYCSDTTQQVEEGRSRPVRSCPDLARLASRPCIEYRPARHEP